MSNSTKSKTPTATTISPQKAAWTPERKKKHGDHIRRLAAAQRQWNARPTFSKIKKHEVVVGADNLLYRRGRPVRCRRNDEVRRLQAEGRSAAEIAEFVKMFEMKEKK